MSGEHEHEGARGIDARRPAELDWWGRWWPRATALMQFLIGAGTFVHEVSQTSEGRMAIQFWSVTLMLGAPSAIVVLRIVSERFLGGPGGGSGGGS